jgi:hypothetical protein
MPRSTEHTDRLRRWASPNHLPVYDMPPTSADPSGNDGSPALVQDNSTPDDRPPLIDDLLNGRPLTDARA